MLPLYSEVGDGVSDIELLGDGLVVLVGDDRGERRFCSFMGSSGGGGASEPLLDLDLTLSSISLEKGSGSEGSSVMGPSD